MDLPDSARCVVIGGGVGGTSIAYHLGLAGWDDVVLLERHQLSDGTTWHSAGFVGQLRSTITQTRMIMYSTALYALLGKQTGRDPGWHGVGSLRLATTPERQAELERAADTATTYGMELDLLSPAQAQQRLGLLNVNDLTGAAWMPGDGYVDPELLALALADGARSQGVAVHTGVAVTGIDVEAGRVTGVQTDKGAVAAEVVVIAAGAATGVVGAMAGAVIPITPMRHQYVVTPPLSEGVEGIPTVRDPDHIMYLRPHDSGGLLVGGYSREPVTWDTDAPLAQPRTTFEPDMERFAESWEGARKRVPALRSLEPAKVVNAPEAFTPDGDFILGETEVAGLWTAAGFCVHGLAGAGGVGKVMAEWITDGRPEYDMASMDIRRFGAHYASRSLSRVRALSAYSRYYDIVYPHQEFDAGRPLRLSPAYPRLVELDAEFGEKAGWERVNWFGANAAAGDESQRPSGWAGRFWSPAIGAECVATRDSAGLFDQSSFAKIDVRGPGAAAALSHLCANNVAGEVGRAVYTQLLNGGGGIEADLTVTRVGEESFRVVTGTAFGRHDRAWIARHLPRDGSVTADDVTGSRCCYCLWGPAARAILSSLTDADLSFKFLRAREISVGPVPVFAQRITFVGELGWELYASAEFGLTLWDMLWEAGREHGLRGGGYRAIDSMRLEKGYRVWGSDITPETTPDEAGLSFAVAMDKEGGFLGHEALAAAREAGGPAQKLRCLVLDDPRSVCLGSEPVRVDGASVGRVTSGGYGHRVERSIAFAYLPSDVDVGARVEVAVFGEWIGAEVVAEPLYDPSFERVRG